MSKQELTTLAELGLELKMAKSKLAYYRDCGLIEPIQKLSIGDIYDKEETTKIINKIKELQTQGMSLEQIKEELINNAEK